MATKLQEIYVNSYLDRLVEQNEIGAKFTVLMPTGTELGLGPNDNGKKVYVKVFNLQIPNVLYNFAEKTSYFFWEDDWNDISGVGTSVEQIQININRIYASPADLISELNTKIQAVDASLNFVFSETTKRVTLENNNTSKKIRVISSFRYAGQETVLTFSDINDRLGFSQSLVGSNGVIDGGDSLTGTGLILMNRTNCYHLVFDEAGTSYQQTIVPIKNNRYRVIANVPVGSYGTLSTLSYVSTDWFGVSSSSKIQLLRFTVLDDDFDEITNEYPPNMPITMSLQFKIE
jgi:hypothetical protein